MTSEWYRIAQVTDEMEQWFESRTNRHISLVQKYCKKIQEYDPKRFSGLIEQAKDHDATKLKSPERDPYVYITWDYKCKEDGVDWKMPDGMKEKSTEATEHHVHNNRHHPEYWSDAKETINREDRDKPSRKMVDATQMPNLSVAEMVGDWLGMSEEKKTDPTEWADKNVDVRWKFTPDQKNLIYELIDAIWGKK